MKNILMALILLTQASRAIGQQTGSFDVNINFMNQQRMLSFFVPANYDPVNKYRLMVCLHGAGDHCDNYRNALINSLRWDTVFANTIILCPDGGTDQSRCHYIPAGDEQIIQQGIDYAMQNYHVDTTNIILQGFSVGGRSALKWGLDHTSEFKGLLLNTPALQGIWDVYVYYIIGGGFAYNQSSKIPIYITVGSNDGYYLAPDDSLYEQLIYNDGMVRLFEIPGMGHTIPTFNTIPSPLSFFDHPTSVSADLDIYRIKMPLRGCVSQATPACIVRNLGDDTLTSVDLVYTWNGNTQTHTWNGVMKPFGHAVIPLPALTANSGAQTLSVHVSALNTVLQDTIAANNTGFAPYEFVQNGIPLPITEGFENGNFPPTSWVQVRAGDYIYPWTRNSTIRKSGSASMVCFNTVNAPNNSGRREYMYTPIVDLSSLTTPYLNFDVAYNYHKYNGVDYADTLEVWASTDCGDNYQRIFKKGGTQLATFPQPILNPTTMAAMFVNPTVGNWRTESIDLSNFSSSTEAIFNFSYKSARGGSIAIDNVNFSNDQLSLTVKKVDDLIYQIFPNPTKDRIEIVSESVVEEVIIYNLSGGKVLGFVNDTASKQFVINVGSLSNGLYFFELRTKAGRKVEKLMIEH